MTNHQKTIVIIREHVPENALESEKDVQEEEQAVADALKKNGFNVVTVIYNAKDISGTIEKIKSYSPYAVFNLVESIDHSSSLCYTVVKELKKNAMVYSGNSAEALYDSTNKVLAKNLLIKAGIAVPRCYTLENGGEFIPNHKYIIKPIAEGGSEGITAKSIIYPNSEEELKRMIEQHSQEVGFPCFAEEFIDGEEYCVALVGHKNAMKALQPSQMQFIGYAQKKLDEILDYSAKWEMESDKYKSTVRTFDINAEIAEKVKQTGIICAKAFKLGGYARIDMRFSKTNQKLYVIDVNANPCLSKDAGFAVSLEHAGYDYDQTIVQIATGTFNNK